MKFSVEWHKQALKSLEKISPELIERILNKFDEVAENPFRYLEHLESDRVYKLRVGDYRFLIDVDFTNKILFVQYFDHRKKVYDYLK